jgi:hypothetical protein
VRQDKRIAELAKLARLTGKVDGLKEGELYTAGHLGKIDDRVDDLIESVKSIEDDILALKGVEMNFQKMWMRKFKS